VYRVRPATIADADVLVRHRLAMFEEMGIPLDADGLTSAFRTWLQAQMPAGVYRAWLVEGADGRIVAGGGMTILPWPPGPRSFHDRLAFVYNVYTEPDHRRRGLGRLVMDTIHGCCREEGIALVALNASRDGLPMYEAMGYAVSPSPMMFFACAERA
jgi:GNAT superfamily N-acetyltransferase